MRQSLTDRETIGNCTRDDMGKWIREATATTVGIVTTAMIAMMLRTNDQAIMSADIITTAATVDEIGIRNVMSLARSISDAPSQGTDQGHVPQVLIEIDVLIGVGHP